MPVSANFPIALSVSLLIHLSLIFSLSALGVFPKQGALNEAEINYYRIKSSSALLGKKASREIAQKDLDGISRGRRIVLSGENKIPKEDIPAFKIGQNEISIPVKDFLRKPPLPKTEFLTRHTIKLSSPELESSDKLSQNPAYLTYGNYVRERIRRCLYSRFSHINDKGVVCLKFAIQADGSLLESRIIDDKSGAGDRLRQIAMDGLRDAAPFPPLPKELNTPAATYTVFIHFINQQENE